MHGSKPGAGDATRELLILVRPYLQEAAGAYGLITLGMGLFLVGAVFFDFLSNFLTPNSFGRIVGICVEETLEMFGATLILWGTYLLAALPERDETADGAVDIHP